MNRLRKQITKILSEAIKDEHYMERLYDRLINSSNIEVGFENDNTVGEYTVVGSYSLPEQLKQQIIQNAKLIEDYNFPRNKSYGIQLAQILIDKNQVKYYSEDLKNQAKSKPLLIVDEKTSSNGNLVYLIVRNNMITTIYFAKNYVPQDATKMKVDGIIKNMSAIRDKKVHQ